MVEASEQAWSKQAEFLAERFAVELRVSRWKYLDTLPPFAPQPEQYTGRLDYLVLVQPPPNKISINHWMKILGSSGVSSAALEKLADWTGDPGKFQTPDKPYATWVDPQRKFLEPEFRFVDDPSQVDFRKVRVGIQPDERGGSILDAIFLAVHNPQLFDEWGYIMNCPGTEIGDGIFKLSPSSRRQDKETRVWKVTPFDNRTHRGGLDWHCGWGGTPNGPSTRWLVASRLIVTKF